ncbi:MAG: signal peptidase I [Proteobacteria bacterium]|nr:signal peptidase I [Pseudomonadota bacterium]
MNFKYLIYKFWSFFWFVALPLAVAWGIVDILDRSELIEEVEVWYVLLLFMVLAYGILSIRNKLPFWRDRDPTSFLNRRRRNKEARQLLKNVQKILTKKGSRVSEKGKSELQKAIDGLSKQLDGNDDKSIINAIQNLEDKIERYLSFARKSAFREYFESIGIAVIVAILLRLFVVEAFKIPSESMVATLMVGDHIFVSKYRYGLSIPFSNKRLVRFARPNYGEVVVFLKPSREEQTGLSSNSPIFFDEYEMVGMDFIKRIVGLPGDKVEMRDDVLHVNGKEVPRCYVGKQVYRTLNRFHGGWEDHESDLWVEKHGKHTYTIIEESLGPKNDFGPLNVPLDQAFVLGDNTDNSNDSRYWGSVPFDNIKGRAMFIWWSNRRPHGFQWDRVGTIIMDGPRISEKQRSALARCQNMR